MTRPIWWRRAVIHGRTANDRSRYQYVSTTPVYSPRNWIVIVIAVLSQLRQNQP